jgi:hypothetical protein
MPITPGGESSSSEQEIHAPGSRVPSMNMRVYDAPHDTYSSKQYMLGPIYSDILRM